MRRSESALSLRHAVALGLVQGPAELLPVSSSAHTSLIPWLAGWRYAESEPELRQSFEVALHAGSAVALAIVLRKELLAAALDMNRRHATVVGLALAPPTAAGYALERFVERRLGDPPVIAVGLLAGSVAMALADGRPARRRESSRRWEDAGPRDGLALGLAQAAALIPGVSRNGATLTVARARGFGRGAATSLSWQVALPVLFGASALKGYRLVGQGTPAGAGGALAAGAASAFLSTLASARLLCRNRHKGRSLLPYSIYRCALAACVVRRLRGQPTANAGRIKKRKPIASRHAPPAVRPQ